METRNHIMVIRLFIVLILCIMIVHISSCQSEEYDSGNMNKIMPTIVYCDGICYIEDTKIIRMRDQEHETAILYDAGDCNIYCINAYDDVLYFMKENKNSANRVCIGCISSNGVIREDITSDMCENSSLTIRTIPSSFYVCDTYLLIPGNGIYGSAFLFDMASGDAYEIPVMYPIGAYNQQILYYTKGEYSIYFLTLDQLTEMNHEEGVFYDGSMFKSYEKEDFYTGVGIDNLTANPVNGTVFFTVRDAHGYSVYSIKKNETPVFLYAHPTQIKYIVTYENDLYFYDGQFVYGFVNGDIKTIVKSDNGFTIHHGRLYYNTEDVSQYISLSQKG